MTYRIYKTDEDNISIDSPLWDKAERGIIKDRGWEGYAPCPESSFKILRSPCGFYILMESKESHLRAEIKEENGAVCTDSCLEFFISPRDGDGRYLNFEINPAGVLHLAIGEGRHDRTKLWEDRGQFRIESSPKAGNWRLCFFIPDAFLLKYFHEISPSLRANAYKCGDRTESPHYGCWSRVGTSVPDFHRPEFFGELTR
ncbi:MAG: hypothetical protein E7623_07085 [Ruminococcaceae bacterium]|nr:hypothetical protein [Oscillospiraceae bacterium]